MNEREKRREASERDLLGLVRGAVQVGEVGNVADRLLEHFHEYGFRPQFLRDLADVLDNWHPSDKEKVLSLLEVDPSLSTAEIHERTGVDRAYIRRIAEDFPGRTKVPRGRPPGSARG